MKLNHGMNNPRPYMTGSEQTGHYRIAFQETLNRFKQMDPMTIAANSGTEYNPVTSSFKVTSFNQEITVSYPDGKTTFTGTDLMPLMGWRLVIINYLVRANGRTLENRLITYKELENGMVYYAAFYRESIIALSKRIRDVSPEKMAEAYSRLGGKPLTGADLAVELPALPHFPVTVKLWFPDEELPGSANILFDASANNYLHTEDIAAIGGYAAAFPITEYRILTGKPWRKSVL